MDSALIGIGFAVAALLSWGFGDFLIQRTTRTVGNVHTLLYIGVAGSVALYPFIQNELSALFTHTANLTLLTVTGIVIFCAALLDFEALKRGKIAIVEPVLSIELPITILLSIALWGETVSGIQLALMGATFIGIILAITSHHTHLRYHTRIFERGVALAAAGAVTMGLVNFLVGAGSQTTSPLMTIWFTNTLFTALCIIYLFARWEWRHTFSNIIRFPALITTTAVLDNAAWIFYAFAARYIPISIVTTITESYIALTVLLGVFINRERIKPHQYAGIALACVSVILLGLVSE